MAKLRRRLDEGEEAHPLTGPGAATEFEVSQLAALLPPWPIGIASASLSANLIKEFRATGSNKGPTDISARKPFGSIAEFPARLLKLAIVVNSGMINQNDIIGAGQSA